jgi:hypothetical protein
VLGCTGSKSAGQGAVALLYRPLLPSGPWLRLVFTLSLAAKDCHSPIACFGRATVTTRRRYGVVPMGSAAHGNHTVPAPYPVPIHTGGTPALENGWRRL